MLATFRALVPNPSADAWLNFCRKVSRPSNVDGDGDDACVLSIVESSFCLPGLENNLPDVCILLVWVCVTPMPFGDFSSILLLEGVKDSAQWNVNSREMNR